MENLQELVEVLRRKFGAEDIIAVHNAHKANLIYVLPTSQEVGLGNLPLEDAGLLLLVRFPVGTTHQSSIERL